MALSIQTGKLLLDYLDLLQLRVPSPFKLARYKPIASINCVVLFEGLSCLIHQLLQLAGQGGTLSGVVGAQCSECRQLASSPKGAITFSSSCPIRRSTELPPKPMQYCPPSSKSPLQR